MKDSDPKKVDNRLKEIKECSKVFGYISIVFVGDVRQLELIQSSHCDLLFSSKSSQYVKTRANSHIILDNNHRFKQR